VDQTLDLTHAVGLLYQLHEVHWLPIFEPIQESMKNLFLLRSPRQALTVIMDFGAEEKQVVSLWAPIYM
jgi:hypothetical protein